MLLNKNLDVKKIRKEFKRTIDEEGLGYVAVDNYLNEKWAKRLYREFESIPWMCKWINRDGEFHTRGDTNIPVDEAGIIDAAMNIAGEGQTVFYYNFYDFKPKVPQYALEDFLIEWGESDEIQNFFNEIMGREVKNPFLNATQFLDNHFCCGHTDRWTGDYGTRAVAFFCHLTPEWKAEWGGQTMFVKHDDWNEITKVISPHWNQMHIIDTETCPVHYINYVTPFALKKRYSLTGWWHED